MAFDPINNCSDAPDCDITKYTLEQLFRFVFRINESGCMEIRTGVVVSTLEFPVAVETPVAIIANTSGSVAAGHKSVIFTTDGSFAGTIAGATAQPNQKYEFIIRNPGSTLAAIAYTRSAGTVRIDTQ